MNLATLTLILAPLLATQPPQPAQGARKTPPVLAFPEPGLDDSAAYQGYQTRFFRDIAGNTVQIYIDRRSGRVVNLWADAENESVGFTARDGRRRPAPLGWGGPDAEVAQAGRARTLEYRLAAATPHVNVGWFLLGSMRVERDFQYARRHLAPLSGSRFTLPELERLLATLPRLDAAERQRHLALLGAPDLGTLRARLHPTVTVRRGQSMWAARVVQPSLDGRDTMALELRADPAQVMASQAGDSISLRSRSGGRVTFTVRIETTGDPLTPLTRDEIFNREFLDFLARSGEEARTGADTSGRSSTPGSIRSRWLERQVRGVELLVSREKLMAGLPNYATYFGRDMLVSALMMRSIWRTEMSEFAIAAALRKLSPLGLVSHEEALGGQAVREAAAEYVALIEEHLRAARAGRRGAADSLLERARSVLANHRRVRENHHMIDDEFQLPVLTARWLSDPAVTAERKRGFLFDSSDGGGPRVAQLLKELALVSRLTAPYARDPIAANLVSFPARDSGRWSSASWRDSNAGYAGGRFAMDVNAIWVPHALEGTRRILDALRSLGVAVDSLARTIPDSTARTILLGYVREPQTLRSAIDAWWGASRHFVVRLDPAEVRSRVAARLAAMPPDERDFWRARVAARASDDSLSFLDVALDAQGRPIGVANTDPATGLFLGDRGATNGTSSQSAAEQVLRDVRLFVRAYPVGLFIDRVGPVVANDAYAPAPVWRAFERDHYHGPRVVWGREVNLFLLGVASRIADAGQSALAPHREELRSALTRVLSAVEASGFRSELWSYDVKSGRLIPVRYGTGSDVQLWSTTDLAVRYALSRLER